MTPEIITLARRKRGGVCREATARVDVVANAAESMRLPWRAHAMPALHQPCGNVKREGLLREDGSAPVWVGLLRGTAAGKERGAFKVDDLGPVLLESERR